MEQRHCWEKPAGQYMPAEQLSHDNDPGAAENVPAGHGEQDVAASFAEKNPGAHSSGSLKPAVGQ
jgi:hypothetical protein